MKIRLQNDFQKLIEKSGVGRARAHQMKALDSAKLPYTFTGKDYDILHINTIFPQSYLMAKLAKYHGKTVIYHAHSTEEDFRNSFIFSNRFSKLFKKWITLCYESADVIFTPTQYSKQLLAEYDLDKPIKVISNGIDLDYWSSDSEEKEAFRVKYDLDSTEKLVIGIGMQIKRKGLLDFVELAKAFPQYRFIWFGYTNPKWLPKDIKEALKTDLPNLTFAGYVNREVIRVAYQVADLFLFPTYEETEGIVLLEAFASKIPTLIRDIPIFQVLASGKEVYKAKAFNDFHDILPQILEGELPSLTEESYKFAEARSIDKIGQLYREYYQDAIDITHPDHNEQVS